MENQRYILRYSNAEYYGEIFILELLDKLPPIPIMIKTFYFLAKIKNRLKKEVAECRIRTQRNILIPIKKTRETFNKLSGTILKIVCPWYVSIRLLSILSS